jgi:hypothetical protein
VVAVPAEAGEAEPAEAGEADETSEAAQADEPTADLPDTVAGVAAAEADSRRVTVVPGVLRYHRDDCILVRFLDEGDVEHLSAAEAERSGCTPCRACHTED